MAKTGEDVVRQVCRRLYHAPCVARGEHAPAFAGEGDEVVAPTIVTAGAGEAVGKDAAFQILAKRLTDIGRGGVEIAPAIKLAGTGRPKLGFKVLGFGLA